MLPNPNVEEMTQDVPRPFFSDKLVKPKPGQKIMYIVRGLPGCGKTTFCRNFLMELLGISCKRDSKSGHVLVNPKNFVLFRNYILSTDDFFTTITIGGKIVYNFEPKMLQLNHDDNKKRAEIQAKLNVSPLFIDNTSTTIEEVKPYHNIAKRYGYTVQIVEPHMFYPEEAPEQKLITDPEWLYKNRNSKNIPLHILGKMNIKYQKWNSD